MSSGDREHKEKKRGGRGVQGKKKKKGGQTLTPSHKRRSYYHIGKKLLFFHIPEKRIYLSMTSS